ncbi:MAG: Ig-like domain-containing protein, partial [Cytophagales bacterium]|nr:Ig-like domain-containing protein [Cytophagales bacterium]
PQEAHRLQFDPSGRSSGNATFTYKVTDDNGLESNVATVTIPVMNVPPVAKDITFGTIKSDAGVVTIDPLVATDGDGTIAKYIVTSLPPSSKGVLSLDGTPVREQQELSPSAISRLQFEPKKEVSGDVYFKYKAVDSNNLFSNVASYTIKVEKAVVPVAAYVPPAPAMAEPLAAPAVTETAVAAGKSRAGWLVGAAALAVVGGGLWWYFNREPKVPEPVAAEMPAVEAQANTAEPAPEPAPVAAIENFQPIALYFNNDHPNPRTTTDNTSLTYGQTYEAYVAQKGKFESEYSKGASDADAAKQEVGAFFDEKVKKGFDELTALSDKLLDKLKEGNKVEITVTGFASPLASNEYNKNLTSRRVSSIENHLRTYKNGQFKEYMDKGMLVVTEQTSGEEAARQGISDDRTNTRASWYSPSASAERRVEITNVTVSKPQ